MIEKQLWFGIVFFGCSALSLSVSTASAQPRDNSLEQARHYMELGQNAFGKGQFEEAANQFISAYSASPFSAFLYNTGLSYEKAGNADKAVDYYRRYLEAEPGASDSAEIDSKIRSLLEGAKAEAQPEIQITEVEMKSLISIRTNPADAVVRILDAGGNEASRSQGPAVQTVVRGKYTVEASHPDFRTVETEINVNPGQVYVVVVEMSQGAFLGFLHVTTDVPGADVYIDDKKQGKVGTTPWGNVLPAGKHTLWVEKPGFEPVKKEFEMKLGQEAELSLAMQRLSFGTVLVKANVAGASVFLDGKPLGAAPIEEQAAPGGHKLEVKTDGMKDYTSQVEIKNGQRTKVLVRMNPKPSRTSAWVSLSFSAALFIGGGITGYFAYKCDEELESLRNEGRLSNDDPRIMKGFVLALGADVAFGLGTVVGALSLYYFLRDPLPPSEGKILEPVDFEANPVGADEKGRPESELDKSTEVGRGPKFMVAPIVGIQTAGLGLALVF